MFARSSPGEFVPISTYPRAQEVAGGGHEGGQGAVVGVAEGVTSDKGVTSWEQVKDKADSTLTLGGVLWWS